MHLIVIFWIENIYTKQTSRALWVKSKLAFKAMLIIMIISLSIAQLSLRSKKGLWRSQIYIFFIQRVFLYNKKSSVDTIFEFAGQYKAFTSHTLCSFFD